MNQGPMISFSLLMMAFTFVGFWNGCCAALLYRRKWWLLCGLVEAALVYGAQEVYSWYRLAYAVGDVMEEVLALAAVAFFMANMAAAVPLAVLAALSLVRALRRPMQWVGAALFVVLFNGVLYGVTIGNGPEERTAIPVTVSALPASFEGYKIAQISDTHIGPYYHPKDLDAALAAAAEAGADLAVITGDLIDDIRFMPDVSLILAARRDDFPDGMLYIWGNHEYFRGRDAVRRGLAAAGIPILENGNTVIRHGEDRFFVAGVDYPMVRGEGYTAQVASMAAAAFAGLPAEGPILFLAHHSDFIDEGLARGAALTLTGHTHAMQLGFEGKPVITPFKYTRGIYSDGEHMGYVSRGNGGWFPFRLGCTRELPIFELRGK